MLQENSAKSLELCRRVCWPNKPTKIIKWSSGDSDQKVMQKKGYKIGLDSTKAPNQ